jgi:Tfp pilus assembly protein PilO
VSRTYKILLVLVVAVLAGGGYWKMVLAPKRVEAADLAERVAVAEAQVAQSQALVTTYRGAQKDYKANYETVVRLGKAVPTDDDTRSLLVQLDASAKRAGADFDSINLNGGGSSTADPTAAAPAAPGAVNAGTFSAMPFSFAFTGTFDSLGDFFARLERFVTLKNESIAVSGRLVRVESLTLAPAEEGWPGLAATVGASAYIVPETTAVSADAAGATTTATSAATTTTTTTSEPGTETR